MDSVVRRLVALRLVRWGAAEQNGTILTGAKIYIGGMEFNGMKKPDLSELWPKY